MVVEGQTAPDFSLYDTEKNKLSLYDQRGRNVLILFFPLAFSSVCTRELCGIRDQLSVFNDADAVVLGISVDSLYTLKKFREEHRLNFSLLSDFNKTVSESYGCLYDTFAYDMKGVSKRAVFLVDRDRMVRHREVLENAGEIPDFQAVQKMLLALA